mgnify:CR=1 FL=1
MRCASGTRFARVMVRPKISAARRGGVASRRFTGFTTSSAEPLLGLEHEHPMSAALSGGSITVRDVVKCVKTEGFKVILEISL